MTERFQRAIVTLKITKDFDIAAIRWATCNFLLEFHCNYVCTVYAILSLISQDLKRSCDPGHNVVRSKLLCIN